MISTTGIMSAIVKSYLWFMLTVHTAVFDQILRHTTINTVQNIWQYLVITSAHLHSVGVLTTLSLRDVVNMYGLTSTGFLQWSQFIDVMKHLKAKAQHV